MKKSDVRTLLFYVRRVFNILLDFIWPQFCLACNREGSLCCGFCLNDIILEDLKPIKWQRKIPITCYYCCNYQDKLVQKLIKYYKYNYLENISNLLVNILEKQARRIPLNPNTIIVNIPLHKNKKRKRGFDQVEILSEKLAHRLSLKHYPLLTRNKDNKPQAQLNKKLRQKNVINIFDINKKILASNNNSILLIDDVVTTGSTLNEATKVLKENNYNNVTCLVLAKNKKYNL